MVYGEDNSGALVSYSYTIAKARKQGLLTERGDRPNFWLIMPDEMLANRCRGELVRIRYPYALKEWYLPGEFPQDDKNPTEKENGIDHSGIAIEGKETYKVEPKKEEPKRKLEDYYSDTLPTTCLLYTSPSPRDRTRSRMPSSA